MAEERASVPGPCIFFRFGGHLRLLFLRARLNMGVSGIHHARYCQLVLSFLSRCLCVFGRLKKCLARSFLFSGSGGCSPCSKKYVLLCAACGGLAIILGSLFAVLYVILRSYTSSLHYFETVPSYVAAVSVRTLCT